MEKLQKIRDFKVDSVLTHITAVVTSGCVLHNSMCLRRRNRTATMKEIIVMSFLLFFVSPLFANLVYKQMQLNNVVVGSYFLGIALYHTIGRFEEIKVVTAVFPIIGRIGMLCGMKNGNENITNIIMWLIMNEFVGSVVDAMLRGDVGIKSITDKDYTSLVANISIVTLARMQKISDASVIFCVLVFLILSKCQLKIIASLKFNRNEEEKKEEVTDNTTSKHPVRKSSVMGQMMRMMESSVETAEISEKRTPRKYTKRKIKTEENEVETVKEPKTRKSSVLSGQVEERMTTVKNETIAGKTENIEDQQNEIGIDNTADKKRKKKKSKND